MIRPLVLSFAWLLALALGAWASPAAQANPSPDTWTAFLAKHVDTTAADGVNRVRYAAVTPGESEALNLWIRARQTEMPSALSPKARLAWWIDLYNAQTVDVVVAMKPKRSILDIDLDPGEGKGPWKARTLTVEGKDLSLDEIENAILRPQFKDPRVHFALNCASLGCPELSPRPWSADLAGLDARLDRAARAFLASSQGATFHGATLRLSSLFDWYKDDFGAAPKERLEWLASHADPALAAKLRSHSGKIEYGYDWSLNSAP